MASTTNRFSSSSNPSGDNGIPGKQSGRQPLPGLSNGRTTNDDRSHDNHRLNSFPNPPTVLHPSSKESSQRPKNLHSGRSAPVSSANSVASSRETSPIRPLPRSTNSTSTSRSVSRSRNNSQELSPSRSSSVTSINHPSIPSALALQNTLSNVNKPYLPPPPPLPSTDSSSELLRPSKSIMPPKFGDQSIQWPRSPQLKSPPPPTLSPRNTLQPMTSSKREPDSQLANTSSKRQQIAQFEGGLPSDRKGEDLEEYQTRSTRNLTRGGSVTGPMLETVQEAGISNSSTTDSPTFGENEDTLDSKSTRPAGESGSESGGNKGIKPKDEKQRTVSTVSRPTENMSSKRSFTSLSSARGKQGESSMTNMIVETETVSSVPQVSLGGGTTERGFPGRNQSGATLRLRPSDETIRPKKEKKKPTRKTTLPPGTVSSKADIFEAKVASAVDDADSSDSEETFVYESNPPDPHPSRQHRYHHSRTPSATSMVSQLDQYGGRSRPAIRDGMHGVSGKRSMKFTNNTYNTFDGEGDDQISGRGSSRKNGHIHSTRHHHIGRHGRNGGHTGLFDQSHFLSSQGSKSASRHLSNNGNIQQHRFTTNFKRDGDTYGYDFDAEGADDERAPLVGSGRGLRSRHGRRPNSSSLRQMEYMEQRRRGCFSRYGACTLLFILFIIFVTGATFFIVGVTKPLVNVYVNEIQNVLASKQEIMLDLDVQATNPNLLALTIDEMDVSIFAKSRYVGSDSILRAHGVRTEELQPRTVDSRRRAALARTIKHTRSEKNQAERPLSINTTGVDKGTDPMPDDPAGDPHTMLLGRVFDFDSPLTFEPSPWKYESSNSTGQIRLTKPGNKTEEGGSLRWERVLKNPFELIVRGVVKYQLPLNSATRSASISSKVNVLPDEGSDGDSDGIPDDS